MAWLAKLLLARKQAYASSCIVLKLDLSSAFDSLTHSSIQQEMVRHYVPGQGAAADGSTSCSAIKGFSFNICEQEFQLGTDRGTVQGGTHSPAIFSRVVALAAQRLQVKWESEGEVGPFLAGDSFLWFLWFVDDGMVMFQSPRQLRHLMPQLQQCLNGLGLHLNIAKCKLLGWPGDQRVPLCLQGVQLVSSTTFLGCSLTIQPEGEFHFLQGLMRRAVQSFFINKGILCHPSATRPKRLQLFQALVVSSFRWALGVVVPSRGLLKAVKVQGTTLMVWLLGITCHRP